MKRALFVNPPVILGVDHVDYPYFANLGLLYSAGLVARAGWSVEVLDAFSQLESGVRQYGGRVSYGILPDLMIQRFPDGPYDLVVIANSPFLHAERPDPETVEMMSALRTAYPGAGLVMADNAIGGMNYVAYSGEDVLESLPQIDLVLRYAGENAMSKPDDLVQRAQKRCVIDDPAGIWERPPPFPAFDMIDGRAFGTFIWRVFSDGRSNPFELSAQSRPLLGSSGCPYRCVFCSSNPGWRESALKPYRVVPLEVLNDWFILLAAQGARKIVFLDDVANMRPDFDGLLELLETHRLKAEFPNGLRADRLDRDTVRKLAGLVTRLSLSMETADEIALREKVRKGMSPSAVDPVVEWASEFGLSTMVHYIVGFAWEGRKDVLRTLDKALELHEKYGAVPAVQFATPVPGTVLYDQCVEDGLIGKKFDSSDPAMFQHRPAFVPPGLDEGFLMSAKGLLDEKIRASRQKKVIINVTYECINHCRFCAVSNRIRKHLPFERLSSIIKEHREKGIDNIDMDGGEPLLHPDLVPAVALARDIGYRQINVTSNGRKLADEALARSLLDAGVTNVLISVHGGTADIHDAITCEVGSFAETMAGVGNIARLRRDGVGFGINTTICATNVSALEPLADLVVQSGADVFNIQFLTPFGSAAAKIVPDPEESARAVMRVIDRVGNRVKIQVINSQFCLFPGYEQYLVADLQKMGRTMVFVWEEAVNLFEYLAIRRTRKPECDECVWRLVCEGFYEFGEGPSDA